MKPSFSDRFYVIKVNPLWTRKMILKMHYAKRMPNIQLAFGLFTKDGDEMIGVCTFGASSNRHLNDFLEGFPSMEFNRLCIDPEKQEKNLLSWFVSQCLKQIEG